FSVSTSVRRAPRIVWAMAVRRKCWSRRTATPIPRNTPHTKKPAANSLALSHGRPRLRKSTSAISTRVKPSSRSAHKTMRPRSRGSSSGHFRCRAARPVTRRRGAPGTLLDGPNLGEELDGEGAELFGLGILQRPRQRHERVLLDLPLELYAQLLERFRCRRVQL